MTLGEKIREARNKAKLSQQELADEINKKYIEFKLKNSSDELLKVGNTAISNWETDRTEPDAATIGFICEITNTEPNIIYNFSNKFQNETHIYTDEKTGLSVSIDTGDKPWNEYTEEEQNEMAQKAIFGLLEYIKNNNK